MGTVVGCVDAVLLVSCGLLLACGDDDAAPTADGDVTTTTSAAATTSTTGGSTTTTTTAIDEATTSSTEDLTGDGIGEVESVLAELLIRPSELTNDPPFVDGGYTPPSTATCGALVDEQIEPLATAGTRLAAGDDAASVLEELRAYENVDDAVAAVLGFQAGSECLNVEDVTAEVGGDEAYRFATADTAAGVFVARVADVVATFEIHGVDAVPVAAFGVGKIAALIEAG